MVAGVAVLQEGFTLGISDFSRESGNQPDKFGLSAFLYISEYNNLSTASNRTLISFTK